MTSRSLVNVTLNAWQKIHHITRNNNLGMLLSASSGGCSGFNYSLTSINSKDEISKIQSFWSKLYIDLEGNVLIYYHRLCQKDYLNKFTR